LTRYIGQPSLDLGLHLDVRGTTLDRVFFVFLDSERHQPRPRSGPGSEGRQREQLFAIVAVGYRVNPDPGPVLFAPYVYTLDTPGWRAEREIYGYPQQQGRVRIRRDATGLPARLTVTVHGIRKFAKDAMAQNTTIIRIKRRSRAEPAARVQVASTELAQWIAERLKIKELEPRGHSAVPVLARPRLGTTAADVLFFTRRSPGFGEQRGTNLDTVDSGGVRPSGPLRMLFLKQFRDILHSDRACYQAIVEASLNISGDIREIPLQGYVLELHDTDSAPIRRELGIPSGRVPVEFAFELDLKELSFEDSRVASNPDWSPATEGAAAGEQTRLPSYVDRGGEAVWRQPSLLYGARIYGFGVNVPMKHQQGELKRCINDIADASNSTYGSRKFSLLACTDIVMLLFVEYERITSGTDDDKRLGGTAYREFLTMQLAVSPDEEFPEVNWYIPFIYLDKDAPRLGGREIFGYPKQLGTIEPFEGYFDGRRRLEPAKELELSATVIRNASKNNAAQHSVIRIEGPKNPPRIEKRYGSALDMLTDLLKIGGGPNGIENALAFGNIGNVFLKQFRDCASPDKACYQAVCKTDTVPGKFRGGGRLDPSDYDITIQNLASEPLFGYVNGPGAKGSQKTTPPVFAYWLDLDFELTNGRVIANPLEAAYVPDLSVGRTRLDTSGGLRVVRRALQEEPETLSDLQLAELARK
jgi:Acetoacetate decarboxylase (ADC)